MRRPRIAPKIAEGNRRGDLAVENDRIAEFPDAEAKKKSERERVNVVEGRESRVKVGSFAFAVLFPTLDFRRSAHFKNAI